jgi:hypothetical protein
MKPWTRRTLLAGGVVVLPGALLTALKIACRFSGVSQSAASELTLVEALYGSPAEVKPLGARFLRQIKSTASDSLQRLRNDRQISQALESQCPKAIRHAVDQSCRDDFRKGRCYCIDGWVLSQTELDIAALTTAS